jgi:queuine tRNA-ribosyltransferase
MSTPHGDVQTPVFMPVGTQATVKTLSPGDLSDCEVRMILGNTYHLFLRPGDELIREAGGLHRFMAWDGPILTDSGGFQVFSLAELRKVTDEGVRFQSHIDGSRHELTPESAVDIQRNLGSDVMMVLDECVGYPASDEDVRRACERTHRWAERAKRRFTETEPPHGLDQALFGIVQGGTSAVYRKTSAESLMNIGFDGYAIGGLAVGEPSESLYEMAGFTAEMLPADKPRYLMGVGRPEDIVTAIGFGVDCFDCVIPTRNGRNGTVYTFGGKLNLRNAAYRSDFTPIELDCGCYACRNFSKAYIRHLFTSGEMLALRLATMHNLFFFMRLMSEARNAVLKNRYEEWRKRFLDQYNREIEPAEKTGAVTYTTQ